MEDESGGDGEVVGDTPELHETIHPGDLPLGHPGRAVAEEKLAERNDQEGGVGGDEG